MKKKENRCKPPVCPLCESTTEVRRELSGQFLRRALSLCFDVPIPERILVHDYRLFICRTCTLEFAWPLEAGDSSFYDWVTKQPNYYPSMRWEWGVLYKLLAADSSPKRLLEVGCGDGSFLELLKPLGHVNAIGLDTTKESVEKCRVKGLRVYAQTLEDFVKETETASPQFDIIASFHCLEHLSDPKGIATSMRKLLAPSGSIFLSTPYSPMSFEHTWFDPLNHPPHHMTRWNLKSYTKLGNCIDLVPTFRMPRPLTLTNRVAETLNLIHNGPQHMQGRRRLLKKAIKNPLQLTREVARQLLRERVNGSVAANVVLAEFSTNDGKKENKLSWSD